MQTLPLVLDEELNAALEAVCAAQGRDKAQVAAEALRRYVAAEQRSRRLRDPDLAALYHQLADEDVALAEVGIADYAAGLTEADRK